MICLICKHSIRVQLSQKVTIVGDEDKSKESIITDARCINCSTGYSVQRGRVGLPAFKSFVDTDDKITTYTTINDIAIQAQKEDVVLELAPGTSTYLIVIGENNGDEINYSFVKPSKIPIGEVGPALIALTHLLVKAHRWIKSEWFVESVGEELINLSMEYFEIARGITKHLEEGDFR